VAPVSQKVHTTRYKTLGVLTEDEKQVVCIQLFLVKYILKHLTAHLVAYELGLLVRFLQYCCCYYCGRMLQTSGQRILTVGCIAGGGFFMEAAVQCDTDQSGALELAATVLLAAEVAVLSLLIILLCTMHQ